MNIHWRTRLLEAKDQEALWDWLYIALWDAPDEPRRPRTVLQKPAIRRLVEHWGRPDDAGLVALAENGEPVGAVWARLDGYDQLDDHGCTYPCLGIAVEEPFRRQGVGRSLLEQFIELVNGRVKGLRLGVNPKNHAAIGLYEKLGFVEYVIGAGGYPQMKLKVGN